MLLDDRCYNCPRREALEVEYEQARKFWQASNCSYMFACGALYNPNSKATGIFKGQESDWPEVYKGSNCAENPNNSRVRNLADMEAILGIKIKKN